MNRIFGILILLTPLLWTACGCPPDEKTGDLSLSDAAKNFLTYDGSETLVFQNASATELRFTAIRGKEVSEDQLCYRTTCTEAKFNSPSSCEYYLAESERFGFFSEDNSIVFDLLLYSDVYDYGTAEFYDAFQLGFSFGASSIVGRHIIEARFVGDFDISTLDITDFFRSEASIVLNGETYNDILVYEENSLAVYIEPGKGVIGFKNTQDTWTLQH